MPEKVIDVKVTPSRYIDYSWNIKYEKNNDTYYGSAECDKGLVNLPWTDLECNDEETAINILKKHCRYNSR